MKSKVLAYVGFAKKSRNLAAGVNTCTFALAGGRVRLVILAEDISPGSEKKIMKEIRKAGCEYIKYGNSEELSRAAGTSGRSVFAISEANLAAAVLKETGNKKE